MAHLLTICAKRYNGHELWTLLGVLQRRGHTFEVVSQETLIRDELTLRPHIIDRTVYDVDPQEAPKAHDAVVVVSGNMDDTEAYWTDNHVIQILQAFKAEDKVVAAICCSVPTLAPVAKGVKVSYFPLVRSRHRLQRFGAVLQPVSLTVDEEAKIITAENQMMTQMWADEISNMLEGKPPEHVFKPSGYTPKGSPRILPDDIQKSIDDARVAKGLAPMPPPPADKIRPKKPR
jgi:putative intracellular protease/amidase